MSDPGGGDTSRWHRFFAAECFNRTWELIDKPERSPAEDDEMLATAFASRFHWSFVGDETHLATGDWQIARVYSLLGVPNQALRFARSALETAEREGWKGWRLASVHEGVARAHACAGDASERARHVKLAETALAEEADEEDKEEIARQLATVPNA